MVIDGGGTHGIKVESLTAKDFNSSFLSSSSSSSSSST